MIYIDENFENSKKNTLSWFVNKDPLKHKNFKNYVVKKLFAMTWICELVTPLIIAVVQNSTIWIQKTIFPPSLIITISLSIWVK